MSFPIHLGPFAWSRRLRFKDFSDRPLPSRDRDRRFKSSHPEHLTVINSKTYSGQSRPYSVGSPHWHTQHSEARDMASIRKRGRDCYVQIGKNAYQTLTHTLSSLSLARKRAAGVEADMERHLYSRRFAWGNYQ